jgi:hypothetical protein
MNTFLYSSISMDCKSVGRCMCNVFVRYFASSYMGTFSQLIIVLIGVFCLHNFIVAWRFGAVGFMFIYFHLFSFGTIVIVLLQPFKLLDHTIIPCWMVHYEWVHVVPFFFFWQNLLCLDAAFAWYTMQHFYENYIIQKKPLFSNGYIVFPC